MKKPESYQKWEVNFFKGVSIIKLDGENKLFVKKKKLDGDFSQTETV